MIEPSAKSNLRRELRQRLGALTRSARAEASRQIADHLADQPFWRSAHWIYAFAPLASEPDLTQCHWLQKRLALPRVTVTGLEFYEVPGFGGLERHSMGMGEPPISAPRAGVPDLVLVPGLGFDRNGGRLGRGGGYYDRLLATFPASILRIGIGFDCQLCAEIPREPHDVMLDGVVTESGVRLSARIQD